MNCPKCGFQQGEAAECLKCGLIFARYSGEFPAAHPESDPRPGRMRPGFRRMRNFYRILGWIALTALALVFALILRNSRPPSIAIPLDAAQRAEEKIQDFQSAMDQGSARILRLDESELNGFLRENLLLKKPLNSESSSGLQPSESIDPLVTDSTNTLDTSGATMEQIQSSVRDVTIELLEDSLRLYVMFDLYGMDQTLELEGTVRVRDGYLQVNPTRGKLGSLPLMAGTLQGVADRIFNSPENKEKFRLSPHIQDIRIERGQFIVTSK